MKSVRTATGSAARRAARRTRPARRGEAEAGRPDGRRPDGPPREEADADEPVHGRAEEREERDEDEHRLSFEARRGRRRRSFSSAGNRPGPGRTRRPPPTRP
ncbi:MAG: hypothetical protein MZV64_63575 [Ignavibacteriales bacterium]|nr:hypothetical protein [Ignavibacteriales bacterium]